MPANPAADSAASLAEAAPRGGVRLRARSLAGQYAVPLALAIAVAVFSLLRPDTFFTVENFRTILVTQSVLIVLALGITLPLAAGEFDLSAAAVLGFAASLIAHLSVELEWTPWVALLVSFLIVLSIGVTNAIFIVHFGVNSLITTLGMGTLVTGIASAVVGATTIGGVPAALTDPMREEFLGLELPVYYALAIAVAIWFILEHTAVGRYVFFTGEGREAARLAGVPVNRTRFATLVGSAMLAWFAGFVLVGQTGAANTTFGAPFLLPAFAAGFLGATTIKPGRYNAWGTVVAVLLLAVGTTGLQLLGAADWVTDVFNGAALVLAVTFARLIAREE